ncbi:MULTISPECIES: type VI secretion system tip protein VgrG [Pseudomonas chlororaphis group]|nr:MULTISPECIES: type VI secretion system tip protein VgrG [Pseudomonas chlororaphis group]MCO7579516.1 type VI secretion system tip protein VgrG [Pseudomonas protegens]MCO7585285.1 type VI secretion system tip protein VgrG [Pseudomonas chlororaphis]MCO7602588.1 type VI secretion system tip protein VgrG [Pseudomonas chlororaphis]
MFAPADTAHFVLSIPSVRHDFKVLAFKGREAISELYAIHIELVSDNPNVDLESLLNQPAFLQFGLKGEGIHGLIDDIEIGDSGKRMTRYHLILRPHLYQLQHRHNQRVYQNLTVPQIIAKVLKEHGILADQYRFNIAPKPSVPRVYCVQYGETDFQFVQRLCFEDGIHWHHEHSLDQHLLVFSDNQTDYPILATARYQQGSGLAAEDPVVSHFAVRFSTRTSQVVRRDYNLKKPDPRSASSGAPLDPVPSTLHSSAQSEALPILEDYRYPGRYSTGAVGQQLSQIALEGHRADYQLAKGQSDLSSFRCGHLVTLSEHPRGEYNQMWLLVSVEHEGRQPQVLEESVTSDDRHGGFTQGYRNRFSAIPWDTFFRPQEPAPKPRLSSQTALVTGPAGEEIWCDEFSRIKIQFHWDREGERNEFSSCWVRVATSWAGEGFGHVIIPRIGMEVLVSFIGGDPEQPLVTGCVPNQHTPVPYPLPANKTRSVFKTRSSLGGNGSNELRIEDKKGAEEIYVHAERDQNIEVEHDETHWVGRDRTKTIDRHERDRIKRNWSINVDCFKTETINLASLQNVGLAKMMNIGTVYSQNVGLHMNTLVGINQSTQVGRSQSTVVGTSYSLKVGDGSVQSAAPPAGEEPAPEASGPGSSIKLDGESITLQVGRSKVVITDAGIYLDGPDIHLVAGNTVNADAPADVHLNSGTAQPAPNLPVDAETTQLKGLDVTDAMPLLIDGSW